MKLYSRQGIPARSWIGGPVLAAALLLGAAPLYAQKQACPAAGKKGDGADIQCHLDSVLAKHDALIGTMKDRLGSCVGKNCDLMREHLKKVESAQQRAKDQHRRYKAADFEDVNTRKTAKCQGANCYEKPEDLEVSTDIETGLGADLVDQLDEIGQGLDDTNALLQAEPASAPLATATLLATPATAWQPLYDYTNANDEPDYPRWLHVADNPRALIPTAFAMNMAASVAKAAEKVGKDLCQQSILGFNFSVACTVLSVVVVALDGTAGLLNYNLSDATAWDTHGAFKRIENVDANLLTVDTRVGQLGGQVDETQAAIDQLQSKITNLEGQLASVGERLVAFQNQVIQLLLTPEGRRAVPASLLACGGTTTPCPPVAVSCSPTTGLCTFN